MSAFKPATRQAVKLKLGLMGPSGSGKTYSALRLAAGLCPGGKVAFLDTENGSASLYADRFQFDVLDMHAPFTVQKFLAAIDDAVKAGYDCLITDSISAEWQQLLEEKEMLDARGGNSFTNWGTITKKHEDFKTAFVQAPIHVIACMRSKQEYVLQTNDKGKQAPVKVGMGAVQREGFEYECSVVFDIDMSHHAKTSKDRSSLFGDDIFQITEDTGKTLLDWLQQGGAPVPEPEPNTTTAPATAPQASASPVAKVEPRATTPRAPMGAAQPVAQGAKAPATQAQAVAQPGPTRAAASAVAKPSQAVAPSAAAAGASLPPTPATEPPAAWVEAIAELAAATVGMPELTRTKLIEEWEKDGPEHLEALKKEIENIKGAMAEKRPVGIDPEAQPEAYKAEFGKMATEMLQDKQAAAKVADFPQEVNDFVDDVDPDTDEPSGGISREQYMALTQLIGAFGINRDALRSYCLKAGHLLPGANGPTLARMKAEEFAKLRDKLCNKKIAAGNETWSARTVRIINATPISTFQPAPAES